MFSCGDERSRLLEELIQSAQTPLPDIGPVPEDIREIIWGKDVDTLKAELKEALDAGKDFQADSLIHKICLREAQEAYYDKYISAGGVAVMGNKRLPDRFLYVSRDIILGMTQKRPELLPLLTPSRERRPGATQQSFLHDETGQMIPSPQFRVILAHSYPDMIPENYAGNNTFNYVVRTAGAVHAHFGWVRASVYDEITLNFVTLFIHEFAHAIHFAIRLLDPTFDDRLETAYAAAKENGSYFSPGNYALTNKAEYWTESIQRWFTVFPTQEFLHNEFRQRDPLMYELLAEWFDLINLREVESKVYE